MCEKKYGDNIGFVERADYCRTDNKKERSNIMIPAGHEDCYGIFSYVYQSAIPSCSRSARSERCRAAHDLLKASDVELLTICSKQTMSSCSRSAQSEQYWVARDLLEANNVKLLTHNYIVRAIYLSWSIVLNNLYN